MKRACVMASMVAQFLAPRNASVLSRASKHASAACHASCRANHSAVQRVPVFGNKLCRLQARGQPFRCLSAASEAVTAEAGATDSTGEAAVEVSEELAAVADSALPEEDAAASSPKDVDTFPEFEELWNKYTAVCDFVTSNFLFLSCLTAN